MESPFSSADIFSVFLKDLRFLVALLYIFGKRCNIFRQSFRIFGHKTCSAATAAYMFGVYRKYTKHIYWVNLVQKFKIVSLSWNLVIQLKYAEFNGDFHVFCFWPAILLLDEFGPKIQNCLFKLKFGTQINYKLQNSMVILAFFVFHRKYSFWENLVQKIKIINLSWNWAPRLIWRCRTQCLCSHFPFLTRNTLFGQS